MNGVSMMYSGEENRQRPKSSANKPPHWIVCRSNTMPNRCYYFDMNSGRAVWNLQDAVDLGNNPASYSQVQPAPPQVPQHLYTQHHHFPEPGNTPEQQDTSRQRVAFLMPAFANIPTSDRDYSRQLCQPIQTIVSDYHSPNKEAIATGACRNEHIATAEPKGTNEVAKYQKLDPRIKRNNGEELTLNDRNASKILEVSNYKTFVGDNSNEQIISVTLADSFLRGTGQSLYQRFAAGQIRTKDNLSKESDIGNNLIAKYGNDCYENRFQLNKNEAVNLNHCSKNDKPNYTDTYTKIAFDPQYAIYDEHNVNDLISVTGNDIYKTCNNVYDTENALTVAKTNNNNNSTLHRMDSTLQKNEKNINFNKRNQTKSINTDINTKNKTLAQLTASPIFVLPLSQSENENIAGKTYSYLYSKSKLTKQVSWIEDIQCNKLCKDALDEKTSNNNDMCIINDTTSFSIKDRNDSNGNKENIFHKYAINNNFRKLNSPTSLTSNNITLQHGPKIDQNNMEVVILEDLEQPKRHNYNTLKNVAHQPSKHSDSNSLAHDDDLTQIEKCDDYDKHIGYDFARNSNAIRQAIDKFPTVQMNSYHNTSKQATHQLSRKMDSNNESTDKWQTKHENVLSNTSKQARQDFPDKLDVRNEKASDWLTTLSNINYDIPKHLEYELSQNPEIKSKSSDNWSTKQANVQLGNAKKNYSTHDVYDNSSNQANMHFKLSKHNHIESESTNKWHIKKTDANENKLENIPKNPNVTNETTDKWCIMQAKVNNYSLDDTENQLPEKLNIKSGAIDNWQKPKILEHRVWSGNPLNLRLTPNRSPNFQIEKDLNQDSRIIETHYNKPLFKSYFDEEKCIFVNEEIADYEETKPIDADDKSYTSDNLKINEGQLYKDINCGLTQMNNETEIRIDDTSKEDATSSKRKRDLSPNDLRLILAAKRKSRTDANVKDSENTSKKFINLRKPPETSKSPKKRVSFSLQDQIHEIERLKPEVPLNMSPSWSLGETDDYSYTEKKSPIFDTETLKTFKVTIRNEKSESYLNGNLSSGDSPMEIDYDISGDEYTLNETVAFSEFGNNDESCILLLDRIGNAENRGEVYDKKECKSINKISFDEYKGHIQSVNNSKPAVFKCEFDIKKTDINPSLQKELNTLSNNLINDDIENQLFSMSSIEHSLTETNKTLNETNSSNAECKVLNKNIMSEKRRAKSRTEKLMDKITAFEKNPTYPKKIVRTVDAAKTKSILQKLKETKTRAHETTNSGSKDCSKDTIPETSENTAGNESPMKPIKFRIIDKRPFTKTDPDIKRTKKEEQRIERENYYKALFEVNSYEKSNLDGYENETQDINDAIQNEMMERIDNRIDEYMTHLVQILEDVCLELLMAKKITTEDLWTLKDQVDCLSKMYELDASAKAKSRKISLIMLDLFETNGNLRKITPEKFMLFYTYGLALTDALQELYPENKTYSDSIDNLSELFKRMETSETDKYFYDLKAASEPCHEDEKPELSDCESIYNHTKYVDNYIDNKTPIFGVLSPSQPKRVQNESFDKMCIVSETANSKKLVQERECDKIKKLVITNDKKVESMHQNQEFRNDKSQEVTDNEQIDSMNDKQIDMSKIDLRILQNIKITVKTTEIQDSAAVEKSEFLVDVKNDESVSENIKSNTKKVKNLIGIACDKIDDIIIKEKTIYPNNDLSRISQHENISETIKSNIKEAQSLNGTACDNIDSIYHNHSIKEFAKIGDSLSRTIRNTQVNSEMAMDVDARCIKKSDSMSKIETQTSKVNADQKIKEYLDLDALDYDYDDSDNDALVVDFDYEETFSENATNCAKSEIKTDDNDNNTLVVDLAHKDIFSEVVSSNKNLDKGAPNNDEYETKKDVQLLRETLERVKYTASPTKKDNNAAFIDVILNEDSCSSDSEADTLKLSPKFAETENEKYVEPCPIIKDEYQIFDIAAEDDILSEDLAASNCCSDTKTEKFTPVAVDTVNENISVTSNTNNEEKNQLGVVLVADVDNKHGDDDNEFIMEADQDVKYDQDDLKSNQEIVKCNQTSLKSNESDHPTCLEDINCKPSVYPQPSQCIENWPALNDSEIEELTPRAQILTILISSDGINELGINEGNVDDSCQNEDDNEITFKDARVTNTNDCEFSNRNEDLFTVLHALNSAVENISNIINGHNFGELANVKQAPDLSLEEVKTLTEDVLFGLRSLLKDAEHPPMDLVEPLLRLAPDCVLGSIGDSLGQLFSDHRDSIVAVMKKIVAAKRRLRNISASTNNVKVLRNGKKIK